MYIVKIALFFGEILLKTITSWASDHLDLNRATVCKCFWLGFKHYLTSIKITMFFYSAFVL